MKNFNKLVFQIFGLVLVFSSIGLAQQIKRSAFDVTNYRMDVQLVPDEQKLNATVDVDFIPSEDTRTVAFELNGSLKIDSITRVNSATPIAAVTTKSKTAAVAAQNQVTFIQDQVGVTDLGPSVKIDLGETVMKGTSVTLRFKYSGMLVTPSGGPLLTKASGVCRRSERLSDVCRALVSVSRIRG